MARNDHTKAERDAWQRNRIANEISRGLYKPTPNVKAFLAGQPMTKARPKESAFDKLNKTLTKEINDIVDKELGKNKKTKSRGGNLVADTGDSECFDDLYYDKASGTVVASFIGPSSGVWEYPMSRADAKDWFGADSLGGYFNAFVREAHGKGK